MIIEKILVVDDEEDLREIISEIFEFEGYKVRTAENGLEALKIMNEFNPDLIVTDIIMPECDGLTLFKELSRLYSPPPPVIFISGYVGSVAIDELKNKENFIAIFSKPIKIDDILNKLNELKDS
ncbi:MAG: response regulator [Bdellovibrionota bacterium]